MVKITDLPELSRVQLLALARVRRVQLPKGYLSKARCSRRCASRRSSASARPESAGDAEMPDDNLPTAVSFIEFTDPGETPEQVSAVP